MTPGTEDRIAFANALAGLVLKHVEDLNEEDRAYAMYWAYARTMEDTRRIYFSGLTAEGVTISVVAAYAYNPLSTYWLSEACKRTIEAGVPETSVVALRAVHLHIT